MSRGRGCCHLLRPLETEEFWDAQIAATVQVTRRGNRSACGLGCPEGAVAAICCALLKQVLGCTDCGNRAGDVQRQSKRLWLRMSRRRGCCHLLRPLETEEFWDAQIAATVQVTRRGNGSACGLGPEGAVAAICCAPLKRKSFGMHRLRQCPEGAVAAICCAPLKRKSFGMHRLRQPCR